MVTVAVSFKTYFALLVEYDVSVVSSHLWKSTSVLLRRGNLSLAFLVLVMASLLTHLAKVAFCSWQCSMRCECSSLQVFFILF